MNGDIAEQVGMVHIWTVWVPVDTSASSRFWQDITVMQSKMDLEKTHCNMKEYTRMQGRAPERKEAQKEWKVKIWI